MEQLLRRERRERERQEILRWREEFRQRFDRKDVYKKQLESLGYMPALDDRTPDMATHFAKSIQIPNWPTSLQLCNLCSDIPIGWLLESSKHDYPIGWSIEFLKHSYPTFIKFSPLRESAKSCKLCEIILPSIKQFDTREVIGITIAMAPQFLMIGVLNWNSKPEYGYLRLCADPGSKAASIGIKVGFPSLPEAGSELHFLLLREWLKACDETHDDHAFAKKEKLEEKSEEESGKESEEKPLPTRVIDVGDAENRNRLRLYEPKHEQGRYIALSHRWGKSRPFSTENGTIEMRRKGIEFDQLPKTFRDAVTVTRKLGVQYLWIDSLCIIQGDDEDWRRESGKMETVFASAYCTIAATSATDSNEGFLVPRSVKQPVRLQDSKDSLLYVYVSEVSENFDHDVEEGELNKRAWVLQERALSRRTIHFAAGQTYWECGSVIRCDNLIQMIKPLNLPGSSHFPEVASRFHSTPQDSFAFEDIFARYSKLSMTVLTDRPVAIAGLQNRLAKFYKTQSTYGIIHRYLHKSLLWQRSEKQKMERIGPSGRVGIVPSWSWMAYQGGIRYRASDLHSVSWEDIKLTTANNLRADAKNQDILTAPLGRILQSCRIEGLEDTNSKISNAEGRLVGWIRYDCDESEDNIERLGCIAIAQHKYPNHGWALFGEDADTWKKYADVSWDEELIPGDFHYALLVKRMAPDEEYIKKVYRRLGVAVIQSEHISFGPAPIVVV